MNSKNHVETNPDINFETNLNINVETNLDINDSKKTKIIKGREIDSMVSNPVDTNDAKTTDITDNDDKTFIDSNYRDIIDRITELRRDAFVAALTHMAAYNNIIGTFGEEIYSDIKKESFIRAAGFIPIPIEGVDTFIFEYEDKSWNEDILKLLENSCDVIKSTLIYKLTEKCPIIYSSKFILVTSSCPYIYNALELSNKQGVNVKKTFIGDNVNEIFKNTDVTGIDSDIDSTIINCEKYKICYKKLEDISKIYNRLINSAGKSNKYTYIINLAKFYSTYIVDLDERLDFFLWLERTLSNMQDSEYPLKKARLGSSLDDELTIEKKKKNISCRCPRSIIKNSYLLEKYFLISSQSSDEESNIHNENKEEFYFDVSKNQQYYFDVAENNDDVSDCAPNGCKFESKYIIKF